MQKYNLRTISKTLNINPDDIPPTLCNMKHETKSRSDFQNINKATSLKNNSQLIELHLTSESLIIYCNFCRLTVHCEYHPRTIKTPMSTSPSIDQITQLAQLDGNFFLYLLI